MPQGQEAVRLSPKQNPAGSGAPELRLAVALCGWRCQLLLLSQPGSALGAAGAVVPIPGPAGGCVGRWVVCGTTWGVAGSVGTSFWAGQCQAPQGAALGRFLPSQRLVLLGTLSSVQGLSGGHWLHQDKWVKPAQSLCPCESPGPV